MPPLMNIADVGDDILKKSLEGNFRGSKVTLVEDVLPIVAKVFPEEEDRTRGHYKILDGMPGNTHAQEVKTFRGVDRLIDVMLGESFAVMVLAKPLPGNGHGASQLETKLDDILYPRLDCAKGRGLYVVSVFLAAKKAPVLTTLVNVMKALHSGTEGNLIPFREYDVAPDSSIYESLHAFQQPMWADQMTSNTVQDDYAYAHAKCCKEGNFYNGTWMSAVELSRLAGLPPGGARHFLVIEPAKTEYRSLLKGPGEIADEFRRDDVLVFTLGNDIDGTPFYINPLEFSPGESISSRVDMLMASISAAFDMEAAIPQILEVAIYRAYQKRGWNVDTNENQFYPGDAAFADGVYAFPTLGDVVDHAVKYVDELGRWYGCVSRVEFNSRRAEWIQGADDGVDDSGND